MPSLNAHKKFGACVYNGLSGKAKRLIAENKEEYLLGLQGPDVMFFYPGKSGNHVFEAGKRSHREPFTNMYERAYDLIRPGEKNSEKMISYFAGCICHFVLDSRCHPLVDIGIEDTGLSHGKLEMELDRRVLLTDRRNPLTYPGHAHLPVSKEASSVCAKFYEGVSAEEFLVSSAAMKGLYSLLNHNMPGYRSACAKIMSMVGHENKVASLIMSKDRSHLAVDHVEKMYEMLIEKVPEARETIVDFIASVYCGDRKIPDAAKLNFSGKLTE